MFNKVEIATALGLWQKYHMDADEVLQEIKKYPDLGATVTFAFGTGDWDDDYEFEVETKHSLDEAWEQAAEKVLDGLRNSIIMGLKLNK